jgi:hypothetical protein
MINICNITDCLEKIEDPVLFREITAYLLFCQYEIEEEDELNFTILTQDDLHILDDFGIPEEMVQINIKADESIQTLYRIVYPTEVLFVPMECSHLLPF